MEKNVTNILPQSDMDGWHFSVGFVLFPLMVLYTELYHQASPNLSP